jgi:hypothetical protein
MDACRTAVTQFFARDLRGWSGLVEGCPQTDVLTWFRPLEGAGTARLGTDDIDYTVRAVEADGFNEPVMMHFRDEVLALMRTEYWSFHAFECAALLESLGEPSARADLVWRERVHMGAEWVYAERGLTLGVVPQTGLIVTVSAYPAGDPASYLSQFAKRRPGRAFPAPRG